MGELFSPDHFVWIIPLGILLVLIVALTCLFFRKEIESLWREFLKQGRYSMPANIIANEPKARKNKTIRVVKESVKPETARADAESKPDVLDRISQTLAVYYDKVTDWFAARGKSEMQKFSPLRIPSEPKKPKPPVKPLPPPPPKIEKQASDIWRKNIISDRLLLTLITLMFLGWAFWLTAKISLLKSIQMRQNILITDLQRRLEGPEKPLPAGVKKIVIYDRI